MTTENVIHTTARFRLPDPPPRDPDEMTAYDHVYKHASHTALALHFGNPDSTLVEYDRWIIASPQENPSWVIRPDLLIAFNVSPDDYKASNGYIISEQGKPPDFVLEVASESTAEVDTGPKRDDYAALGIPEYWRFDETGEHHLANLAGDRLARGCYEPVTVETLPDGALRGYSAVLDLILEWRDGQLNWIDPNTEDGVPTFQQEREQRIRERDARIEEQQLRIQEQERTALEREARLQAEARNRELEEELRRLRGE